MLFVIKTIITVIFIAITTAVAAITIAAFDPAAICIDAINAVDVVAVVEIVFIAIVFATVITKQN